MSMKSCADFHQERFEATFASCAGTLTGRLPKSARRAQEKDRMTKSTPILTPKPPQSQERPEQQPQLQSRKLNYRPLARQNANSCLSAREPPTPHDRIESTGPLTSRDYGAHSIDKGGPADDGLQRSAGAPTEKALAASGTSTLSPTKVRITRSQCSTTSSS